MLTVEVALLVNVATLEPSKALLSTEFKLSKGISSDMYYFFPYFFEANGIIFRYGLLMSDRCISRFFVGLSTMFVSFLLGLEDGMVCICLIGRVGTLPARLAFLKLSRHGMWVWGYPKA